MRWLTRCYLLPTTSIGRLLLTAIQQLQLGGTACRLARAHTTSHDPSSGRLFNGDSREPPEASMTTDVKTIADFTAD
jgi:hypothetical protein